jgi:ABC-2 type transport system ATP-binding protein
VKETPVLSVQQLTKVYGRRVVLNEMSFDLHDHTIVALLGANGAGKTTTFKCVLGMTDFRGKISVGGKSVKHSGKEIRRQIGYLPQTPGFADGDRCYEALNFLADLRGVPRNLVPSLLERVNLSDQMSVRIRELSGGMRQRLALAAALLSDPPLLLLDEPTANLDFQSRSELHDLLVQLREDGRTVVLSTHFTEHVADIADRVILLQDGQVALDRSTERLFGDAGRGVAVHLNGTPSDGFLAALRSVGIDSDQVAPMQPNLQAAINRALGAADSERESDT